jgi:opacity protein-like surface antigen
MAKAAILAVVVALAVQLAAAADHPVGGDGSWDASGNGYDAWSATQTFKPGDTLCKKHKTLHMHLICHSVVIAKQ